MKKNETESIHVMPINVLIEQVTDICQKHHVRHLSLFGSFAKGNARPRSDIDFIVYGCEDYTALKEEIDNIPTLRKIDLFDYDEICSKYLREDMDQYGIQIY